MTKRAKPATWGGQRGSQGTKKRTGNFTNSSTKTVANQALPIPGTALAALLKRYRRDLLTCEFTREVSQAMDCVDGLLILVEAKP